MRIRVLMAAIIVVAMTLQGCAGAGQLMSPAQQESLQSLQLFNADSSPRFTFYLACTSDSVNCVTVENAFSDWAADRHVSLRAVGLDDGSFRSGQPSRPSDQAMPYRVAVHFAPWIVAGYTVTSLDKNGGSYPPVVGYSATMYVFDAATGRLLQTLPVRAQQTADGKGDANPYIRSTVRNYLASLDPAYAKK